MKRPHLLKTFYFLVVITAVLAACQPETVTVEVTRVITETETIVEEVEVTRVVEVEGEEVVIVETVTETLVVTVTPSFDMASGGESIAGAAPPPPEEGAKVEEPRTETVTVDAEESEAVDEPRSESGSSDEAATADEESVEEEEEGETAVSTTSTETTAETIETSSSVDLTLDQNSRLTAGEVDDNEQWDDYLLYVRDYSGASVIEVNVSERHQIWVEDSRGNPILGATVNIFTGNELVTTLRTHSDGRSYFFPQAYPIQADVYTVNVEFNGATESFIIPADGSEREWRITHAGGDQIDFETKLDILFLIDATGSMSDEINQLKENIRAISAQIDALPTEPDVRFGMVTYRDRGDAYVTQLYDFTPSIEEFAELLAGVEADGGGDYPEDLNEALSDAVHEVEWRVDGTVSLVFLVADAPPHLDYQQDNHYAVEMQEATTRGIKIYPIASSGLDEQGEYIFRQMAQYTGGRFIFLTYGADGAGTTGTETDFEVEDYSVASLDQLVVRIVEEELSYLVR